LKGDLKMKVKVIGEYYALVTDLHTSNTTRIKTYEKYTDEMFWDALAYAGNNKASVRIERITRFKVPEESEMELLDKLFFAGKTEAERVTGHYDIAIPNYASRSKLSRYHPVNGWVIPEEIEMWPQENNE
jgi:hypothetical protein